MEDLKKTPDELKLIIFDDQNNNKQSEPYIMSMYKFGRKCSCTVIYLAQSYFDIPRFIRKNLMYLFLLKISSINDLKLILKNYELGVSVQQMLKFYEESTKEPMNVLKIDLRTRDDNKRFSKNFKGFFQLN
jgi:hypothetical protein